MLHQRRNGCVGVVLYYNSKLIWQELIALTSNEFSEFLQAMNSYKNSLLLQTMSFYLGVIANTLIGATISYHISTVVSVQCIHLM